MKTAIKIYRASTKEEVEKKPYEDGAIYFIKDSEAIAYDINGESHRWILMPNSWDGSFKIEDLLI